MSLSEGLNFVNFRQADKNNVNIIRFNLTPTKCGRSKKTIISPTIQETNCDAFRDVYLQGSLAHLGTEIHKENSKEEF